MGKSSSEVKRRYNAKTYTRWTADLRNEDNEVIETLRASLGLSRAQFLKLLFDFYTKNR